MNKAKLLLPVDAIAFLALLISTITGIMMWLGAGRGLRDIHVYASLIFAAIVLIHILLHYSWIKNVIFR